MIILYCLYVIALLIFGPDGKIRQEIIGVNVSKICSSYTLITKVLVPMTCLGEKSSKFSNYKYFGKRANHYNFKNFKAKKGCENAPKCFSIR